MITKYIPTSVSDPKATLRDQFAMAALTGLLASDSEGSLSGTQLAAFSYNVANAMLAARDKK